ncbi:MAG: ABC transporter ATP-binding protein/permease [Methanobrevibacter sp.]|jgi:ATP-binding cassette subfamily B protein|nr:ABC transporter ATP-binding protein/permease [Methanobrevibacter sp.]
MNGKIMMITRLLKLFFKKNLHLLAMILLLLFSAILAALGPIVLGQITDIVWDGVKNHAIRFDLFFPLLITVFFIYLGEYFTHWGAGWISIHIVSNASHDLRQQIEEKIWKLPLIYFDQNSRGDILSRVTNDIDNITEIFSQTMTDLIYFILMIVGVVFMMFVLSWQLALITLTTILLFIIIFIIIMKVSGPYFKKQRKSIGIINSKVEETVVGQTLIKVYGQEEKFKDNFNQENQKLYNDSFKAEFISQIIIPVTDFVTNLNYVIVALIGGLQILSGQMTLGQVQAFIQYVHQFSQPLADIAEIINLLQSAFASAERVFDLLDSEEEISDSYLPQTKESTEGLIEFKDVSFSYDLNIKLIKNMNLVANPGQTVAIVGSTGAGKTTLVNLIMRFYEVNKGLISLDGKNISEMSRATSRLSIGMVLQDTWLFNGTIEENIKYGLQEGKKISHKEFMESTKSAYVDNFVSYLPEGYKTVLNDDNSSISVGEKQLITIARLFLSNPDILILDEATSSVDTRTEILIQKAMRALHSKCTSFVIAHRLSTIRNADKIIVMDKGKIVEQGSHNELIKSEGHYSKLYQSQFEGFEL